MEKTGEDSERIPEKYKNHGMIGKYEYEKVDKDTGKECHRILFVLWESYSCFINICDWLKANFSKSCC